MTYQPLLHTLLSTRGMDCMLHSPHRVKIVPLHNTNACKGVEIQLQLHLPAALDKGEQSSLTLKPLYPWRESPRYTVHKKSEPVWAFQREEKFVAPAGNRTPILLSSKRSPFSTPINVIPAPGPTCVYAGIIVLLKSQCHKYRQRNIEASCVLVTSEDVSRGSCHHQNTGQNETKTQLTDPLQTR